MMMIMMKAINIEKQWYYLTHELVGVGEREFILFNPKGEETQSSKRGITFTKNIYHEVMNK